MAAAVKSMLSLSASVHVENVTLRFYDSMIVIVEDQPESKFIQSTPLVLVLVTPFAFREPLL